MTCGLVIAPQLAIGDGALGSWKAFDKMSPTTRHQRCWVQKTVIVLNKAAKVHPVRGRVRSARNLAGVGPRRQLKRRLRHWLVSTAPDTTSVKQDHRAIKRMARPMLGFKSFWSAAITLAGIEIMHMIRKGQLRSAGKPRTAQQFYSLTG